MFIKLWALSTGPLLIIILSAQLVQSQYGGNRAAGGGFGVGEGYFQPQRQEGHYHLRHNNRHGHQHNSYPYPDQGNDGYSPHPSRFERPRFGGFGAPENPGYHPGFGGHRHGVGHAGDYDNLPRPDYGGGSGYPVHPHPWHSPSNPNGFRQPGNNRNHYGRPLEPNVFQEAGNDQQPGSVPFAFQQPGNDPSGDDGQLLQPRPGQVATDSNSFQQPGQFGSPIQPRPHTVDNNTPNFNFQTPGDAGSPLQPRPGQGPFDTNAFQQPERTQPGTADSPLQPRPVQGNTDPYLNGQTGNPIQPRPTDFSNLNFQQPSDAVPSNPIQPLPGQGPFDPNALKQPGTADSPLQPRPGQGNTDPYHTSVTGQTGKPIQPRPTDFSNLNLQQPSDAVPSNPIQPLPGQGQGNQSHKDELTGSTIKPHPIPGIQPGIVEDNIAAIFNTTDFVSTQLNEGSHGHEYPKDAGRSSKMNTDVRILLESEQKCGPGYILSGEPRVCRPKA